MSNYNAQSVYTYYTHTQHQPHNKHHILIFNAREEICIHDATKYRSALIPQCQKHKSERIIHLGSTFATRHWPALRIPRVPPIFRMRSIYEYITKSRGKLNWTCESFSCPRRKGSLSSRRTVLVDACQPFHRPSLLALGARVAVLSLAQLRSSPVALSRQILRKLVKFSEHSSSTMSFEKNGCAMCRQYLCG